MMGKILTFGEIIMRLSPPGNRTMKQSHEMEFFFGGTGSMSLLHWQQWDAK
jgi:2-dehydro-3-deoxygluconokinase